MQTEFGHIIDFREVDAIPMEKLAEASAQSLAA